MSVERHFFPGNNSPQGFFSYYRYILGQREASRIICIKGGPGTGKSTFIRKICRYFAEKGENIDYLHCSADENSLDGAILKNRRIAIIDGTAPHAIDPVTPGAVDKIVNLGEYWNEDGIAACKEEIISLNEETSYWYRIAYNYLRAASAVSESLKEIYAKAIEASEVYRVAADIIAAEYRRFPISIRPGKEKKSFISAITADGIINYIESMAQNVEKVYVISVPEGYGNTSFMELIKEGAIYRGFETESYYCPMNPQSKTEHLIIPQLSLAFITVNSYHDIEPWEIIRDDDSHQEITLIDVRDYMNPLVLEENSDLIAKLLDEYGELIDKGVEMLGKAKEKHLRVENLYIPNMNFSEVDTVAEKLISEIENIKQPQ